MPTNCKYEGKYIVNLDELRQKIDALDAQIVETLNERARAAQNIGELKRGANAPIYVPEREKAVFTKLSERNSGPLDDKAIQAIYREIISAIRALEKTYQRCLSRSSGHFQSHGGVACFWRRGRICSSAVFSRCFYRGGTQTY